MSYILPGKELLEKHSIEIENQKGLYNLSKLIYKKDFNDKLLFPVGIDKEGEKYFIDFSYKTGMLISGETGSGKSIFLNDIIISLLLKNTPDELQFIFIDPRDVEFNLYNGIPLLYKDNIFSSKESMKALDYVYKVMEGRKNLLSKEGTSNIYDYNLTHENKLPQIILIIDEAVDILEGEETESIIRKILPYGYKLGIHLILSTSSYLKSYLKKQTLNLFNYVISFDLATEAQADYMNIKEANLLKGNGDALIKCNEDKIINIQTPYVSEQDISEVVNFIKDNNL